MKENRLRAPEVDHAGASVTPCVRAENDKPKHPAISLHTPRYFLVYMPSYSGTADACPGSPVPYWLCRLDMGIALPTHHKRPLRSSWAGLSTLIRKREKPKHKLGRERAVKDEPLLSWDHVLALLAGGVTDLAGASEPDRPGFQSPEHFSCVALGTSFQSTLNRAL